MRALFIALTLASTSAFACPQLAGTYKECRSTTGNSSGSTDMVVSQSVQNKVSTYTVTATNNDSQERETEIYKADGKAVVESIEDTDSGMIFQTSTVVSCSGNVLNINIDMKLNGMKIGYSKVKVSKNGKQLIIDSKNFDGEEEVTDKEICE